MKKPLLGVVLFFGASCSGTSDTPQTDFFGNVSVLCGHAYSGTLVSSDEVDEAMRGQPMVMHVSECSETEIRIPFYVGEDRSRVWVLTKEEGTLTLKHIHSHEDGEEDILSRYGGTTTDAGRPTRQTFPADEFSKDLFTREGIPQSAQNVWAMDIIEGELFAYEMSRPGRFFRVNFDLLAPVPTPPAPWGREPE